MNERQSPLLIVRAIITDSERLLVLRRAPPDVHNAGLWELPGGKVDAGEELPVSLGREVQEETGLTIHQDPQIVHVESEIIRSGKYEGRLYVALFYAAQLLDGHLRLSSEHGASSWDTPEQAMERELTVESRRALKAFHTREAFYTI
ncbi:MAG: putative hydrolase [Candidatus Saccharibacteria bacterium]|nr:putative hydrolase [Candidatus Saccharibacteria bacterium]